ncbi:MAG: hypothetical protein ACMUHX_05935 [bacterium]
MGISVCRLWDKPGQPISQPCQASCWCGNPLHPSWLSCGEVAKNLIGDNQIVYKVLQSSRDRCPMKKLIINFDSGSIEAQIQCRPYSFSKSSSERDFFFLKMPRAHPAGIDSGTDPVLILRAPSCSAHRFYDDTVNGIFVIRQNSGCPSNTVIFGNGQDYSLYVLPAKIRVDKDGAIVFGKPMITSFATKQQCPAFPISCTSRYVTPSPNSIVGALFIRAEEIIKFSHNVLLSLRVSRLYLNGERMVRKI